ncbi:hypothetical protein SFC08_13180 [Lysinibacillus halotolerans]
MSKLDPRPNKQGSNYSWDDLNRFIQSQLSQFGVDKTLPIDVRNYSMSKEEIISEAEKQGYKVIEKDEYYLEFK